MRFASSDCAAKVLPFILITAIGCISDQILPTLQSY
jgi:hypothetical protein